MSIPWIFRRAFPPRLRSTFRGPALGRAALLLMVVAGPGGCTYSGGELLYVLGFGRGPQVPAEFKLADGPILILIDDPGERIDWPPARKHLFEAISQQLIKTGSAKKIIPNETLLQIRRSQPDYEKRGCREIGALAGAEQVLWLEVQEFFAQEQFYDPTNAAYYAVNVKVIDVDNEEGRSRVRAWPTSPEGHPITVSLGGVDVSVAKTRDGISKKLAERLAVALARLFHEHRLDDFERPT
jgi:hypothetical protein